MKRVKKQGNAPAERRDNHSGKDTAGCLAVPVPLERFPGIPMEYVEVLRSKGIGDTESFIEATLTNHESTMLASSTGIPAGRIMEIRALCDLARIRGMGAATARVLYHAGIRSAGQLAEADPALLYKELKTYPGAYKDVILPLRENDLRESIRCAGIIVQRERRQREQV
jgi:predicted RecB family nuclease